MQRKNTIQTNNHHQTQIQMYKKKKKKKKKKVSQMMRIPSSFKVVENAKCKGKCSDYTCFTRDDVCNNGGGGGGGGTHSGNLPYLVALYI